MEVIKWIEIITNPELYIDIEIAGHKVGIYFLMLIAFAEAGLLAGLFFSSDSFLFVAGIYSNKLINQLTTIHNDDTGVIVLAVLIASSSIIGNTSAFWYGSKAEKYFNNKNDGLLYKRKYLEKSKAFFQKYGGWAIISSHYVPVVRTFMPMLSAISGMKFTKFVGLVTISSTVWSFSIILLGHYLYKFLLVHYAFDLRQHLWLFIFVLLVIVVIYLLFRFMQNQFLKNYD